MASRQTLCISPYAAVTIHHCVKYSKYAAVIAQQIDDLKEATLVFSSRETARRVTPEHFCVRSPRRKIDCCIIHVSLLYNRPKLAFTACMTLPLCGKYNASRFFAYGVGTSSVFTRSG